MTSLTFHITTPHLYISHFLPTHAPHISFLKHMYNIPSFIAAEGDTGIDTFEKAEKHVREWIVWNQVRLGFGCFLVSLRGEGDEGFCLIGEEEGEGEGEGEGDEVKAKREGDIGGKEKDKKPIPIGCITLMQGNPLRDTKYLSVPDIGWVIIPPYTGNGYATEAARALMKWAEDERGIKEMFCFTGEKNAASRRVVEKLGFVGGRVENVSIFGCDSCVYKMRGMGELKDYVKEGVKKEEGKEGGEELEGEKRVEGEVVRI